MTRGNVLAPPDNRPKRQRPKRDPDAPQVGAMIGMTGYCHRGDHKRCPHHNQDPATWRSSGRSDDPGFGDYPDCACSCHVGMTGYCSHGRHKSCKYGPGRLFPDGIVLSDGKRERVYMCPCPWHTPNQSHQRTRHSAAPWTAADLKWIAEHLDHTNVQLANKLGRTPDAIKHKRRALTTIQDW